MSFILDALRKSEQERQIASGRGAGMLFPMIAEHNPKPNPALLLLTAVLCAATAAAAFWWFWPQPSSAEKPNSVALKNSDLSVVAAPVPAPALVQPGPMPAAAAVRESGSKAAIAATAGSDAVVEASAKKRRLPGIAATASAASTVAPVPARVEPVVDAPKGLPALSITGYINGQDGTRLVIVNDQLLREGDEVSPGLRVEKIIDDAAVFSYKGQRFQR